MYTSVRHSGTTWKREKIYLATGTKHTPLNKVASSTKHQIRQPKDDTMTAHSFAESMLQCLRWRNGEVL
jgi:hypothetical protein